MLKIEQNGKEGVFLASIKDVAKKAGVSVAAVSKYLKTPENMRETTRTRIAQAITELNYHPNPLAQSLRTGRTHIIAITLPEVDNPYFTKMFKESIGKPPGKSLFSPCKLHKNKG